MEEVTAPKQPLFVAERLFADPTPNGRINQRIVQHFTLLARELTDLSDKEFEEFFGVLLYLGRKLASVWQHLNRYQVIQADLLDKLDQPPPDTRVLEVEYSQELFQEFDEFLVQLKSSLDHLVKIGRPILGPKIWNIQTFGEKGRSVEKALENNLPREQRTLSRKMSKIVFGQHRTWLNDVIKARDKVNHFIEGGLRFEHFGVHKIPDGTVLVPMWNDEQTLGEAMQAIWENLIRFTEDFLAMFLFLRRKPGLVLFHGPEPKNSAESPWMLATEAQMKTTLDTGGWTTDLPEA
jgi:hypothetical protein